MIRILGPVLQRTFQLVFPVDLRNQVCPGNHWKDPVKETGRQMGLGGTSWFLGLQLQLEEDAVDALGALHRQVKRRDAAAAIYPLEKINKFGCLP